MTNEEFKEILKREKSAIKKCRFFRLEQSSGYLKQRIYQQIEFDALKEILKRYDYIDDIDWVNFIRQNPTVLKFTNLCLDIIPNALQTIRDNDYSDFMDIFYEAKRNRLIIARLAKRIEQSKASGDQGDFNQAEDNDSENKFEL